MRHRVNNKKFKRDTNSRKALKKGLILSFLVNGKIESTLPKVKFIKPEIEKIITKAKVNSLHVRRLLLKKLNNDNVLVEKVINDLGVKFKDRNGGYTRIYRTKIRKGDNTQMAVIELIGLDSVKETKVKDSDKKLGSKEKSESKVIEKEKPSKKLKKENE
jgi:large subunit ribosomal protein L17